MKKIPSIMTMLFPYLFVLIMYVIKIALAPLFGDYAELFFIVFVILAFFIAGVFMITVIITAIKMVFKWESRKALLYNMVVKVVYIPVHIFLILLSLFMGNPFLMMFMFVPILLSLILLSTTGIVAVSAIIKGYVEKKYSLLAAVVFGILSFFYILDIVVAIIALKKTEKQGIIAS